MHRQLDAYEHAGYYSFATCLIMRISPCHAGGGASSSPQEARLAEAEATGASLRVQLAAAEGEASRHQAACREATSRAAAAEARAQAAAAQAARAEAEADTQARQVALLEVSVVAFSVPLCLQCRTTRGHECCHSMYMDLA